MIHSEIKNAFNQKKLKATTAVAKKHKTEKTKPTPKDSNNTER